MNRFKRPSSIIIFSLVFLLSPAASIVSNAYINLVPLWGPGSIFSRMAPADLAVLFLYPVAAAAIFTVRPAGWWVFIASAMVMLVRNIAAFIFNPMIPLAGMVVFNLFLFGAAGFFFRKHIIAPYFNPRLRWWEQASRYEVDLGVVVENHTEYEIGFLEDISVGGCFIRIHERLEIGHVYLLRISLGSRVSATVSGRVMRAVNNTGSLYGYGIMFVNVGDTESEGISHMIDSLETLGMTWMTDDVQNEKRSYERYLIRLNVSLKFNSEILPAILVNFSTTGACLETTYELRMGQLCGVFCNLGYSSIDLDGSVKWKRNTGRLNQYGIAFLNMTKEQKKAARRLLDTIISLGGSKREADKASYEKMVQSTLMSTPYKLFYFFRRGGKDAQ